MHAQSHTSDHMFYRGGGVLSLNLLRKKLNEIIHFFRCVEILPGGLTTTYWIPGPRKLVQVRVKNCFSLPIRVLWSPSLWEGGEQGAGHPLSVIVALPSRTVMPCYLALLGHSHSLSLRLRANPLPIVVLVGSIISQSLIICKWSYFISYPWSSQIEG